MLAPFDHVRTWIFDLDNTLYPASADLFGLIDARMGQFIQNLLGVLAAERRASTNAPGRGGHSNR